MAEGGFRVRLSQLVCRLLGPVPSTWAPLASLPRSSMPAILSDFSTSKSDALSTSEPALPTAELPIEPAHRP